MSRRTKFSTLFGISIGALVVIVGILLALHTFEAGRAFTVRSYVRAERAWNNHSPDAGGKGLFRRAEPSLVRAGLLNPVRVEVDPDVSLLLDPGDDVARTILISRAGRWEPEVWAAISSGLSPGAVFFDVGAHTAYDSLKASRVVGDQGRVVAFEPNPNTLSALRSNIAASRSQNVIVQPIACTDVEQMLALFDSTPGGNSSSSSLSEANAGERSPSDTVKGRPIDAVVAETGLTRLDVLKADVEGAELLVLRGATETLRRFHPKLILEVVPRQLENMNTSVEELEPFIRSHGDHAVRVVDYKNREYTAR